MKNTTHRKVIQQMRHPLVTYEQTITPFVEDPETIAAREFPPTTVGGPSELRFGPNRYSHSQYRRYYSSTFPVQK